jgi:hypothetical protein
LKLVVDLLPLAGEEVVYKLVGTNQFARANRSVGDSFGCRGRCHVLVRAVRCAFAGNRGEAYGAHRSNQGFKCGAGSRSRADDVDVIEIWDDLCGGM